MGRPRKKRALIDDDDWGGFQQDDKAAEPAENGFKINEEYARRFQHNKEREDLHRLRELEKRGLVNKNENDEEEESDSETEDEEGLLPKETEKRIFDTLAKLRMRDPTIYNPDVKFFDEAEAAAAVASPDGQQKKEKKKKAVYLKDVVAQQFLDSGVDEEDDTEGKDKLFIKKGKSYAEEQEELKNAFLEGVAAESELEDEGNGLLRVRSRAEGDGEEEGAAGLKEDEEGVAQRLQEYFGKEDALDENERFLKDFLLKQQWIDKDKDKVPSYCQLVGDSEDEEEVEKQELFEASYNFRFEEPGSTQVVGHSRAVEGSVRRKDDARKRERERKKERMSQKEAARQAELKRLKNLKRKEIVQKLEKIQEVAGAAESEKLQALMADDLEEDFDPATYDKQMREAFGADYYAAEDPNLNELGADPEEAEDQDLEKPVFGDSDEELAAIMSKEERKAKGFKAVREKQQATGGNEGSASDEFEEEADGGDEEEEEAAPGGEEEEEEGAGGKKEGKKRKLPAKAKVAFEKHLEEYYKLDYEDVVGDLPTRFKYREVPSNKYGMTVEDILEVDDKELNAHVSLKKLAPYRTDEWVPNEWMKKKWRLSRRERKQKKLEQHGIPSGKGTFGRKGAEKDEEERQHKKKKKKERETKGEREQERKPREVKEGNVDEGEQNGKGNGVEGGDAKKRKRNRKKRKGGEPVVDISASRLQSYGHGVAKPAKKAKW